MSRDKLIIIGVVLLAALGFGVWKQAQKDEAIGKPQASSKDFPTVSAPDDIDKISITNGDKGEIVLDKTGGGEGDAGASGHWTLSKPLKAEANQQSIKDLVANLKDLKVDSQLNLKLDDDVRKDKQLDPAHAVHVVAWKGADKKLDELFGKSGTAGQLALVTDKPDVVWAVKGYSSYLYTKEPKDFRDKELLKFDDSTASQVTIANSHGTFSFTKGDHWGASLDSKALPRFDEQKIKDMLSAFKALNADDFGDGKSLADTGLEKPEATVTITLKDGTGKRELAVGNTATGTNRWAKKSDSDQIVQITSYAADWATSDAPKYQSPADAGTEGGVAGGTAAKGDGGKH
jgi:hypothetical protein